MGDRILRTIGKSIVALLQKRLPGYEPYAPSDPHALASCLQHCDVLLVEGDTRVSAAIKYLTQSTWSHAALFVGPIEGRSEPDGEPHVLIEAYIGEGVVSAPLSRYRNYHTRICRPVGLTREDAAQVMAFTKARIGLAYDTKNILDLMRYLIPLPIPSRFRRRMIALGSGDPSRAICSTLIAQAFESVRYPILPRVEKVGVDGQQRVKGRSARREILHIRHYSLYTPRDFDISPYFAVIKPTILRGFNYKRLTWSDQASARADAPLSSNVTEDASFEKAY
jgi:hypothetical protein